MTLKERIENNLTLYILGIAATAFGAGIGGYKILAELPSSSQTLMADWKAVARAEKWIPQSECPAYPMSLNITSPGADAVVELSEKIAYLDLVVQTSRPLAASSTVGLVVRQEGQPNYYVTFPVFAARSNTTVFRDETYTRLPFSPDAGSRLSFWAFVTDDRAKFGSVYTSLDQLKSSAPEIAVSPVATVNTKAK